MTANKNTVTVTVPRYLAEALIEDAEILIHEDQIEGVPEGVLYDTETGRWTWALDEALGWALERLPSRAEPRGWKEEA